MEECMFKILQTNNVALAFIRAFNCSQSYWSRYQQQQKLLAGATTQPVVKLHSARLIYFGEETMGAFGTLCTLNTRAKVCNWIQPYWRPASSMGHQTRVFSNPWFWTPNHFALESREFTSFSLFIITWGGVGLSHLVCRPIFGLLYQPRKINDDDCVIVGWMRIGRGNSSTRRKSAPLPLYPRQVPHDLN
jgi:hypothetical protein